MYSFKRLNWSMNKLYKNGQKFSLSPFLLSTDSSNNGNKIYCPSSVVLTIHLGFFWRRKEWEVARLLNQRKSNPHLFKGIWIYLAIFGFHFLVQYFALMVPGSFLIWHFSHRTCLGLQLKNVYNYSLSIWELQL